MFSANIKRNSARLYFPRFRDPGTRDNCKVTPQNATFFVRFFNLYTNKLKRNLRERENWTPNWMAQLFFSFISYNRTTIYSFLIKYGTFKNAIMVFCLNRVIFPVCLLARKVLFSFPHFTSTFAVSRGS